MKNNYSEKAIMFSFIAGISLQILPIFLYTSIHYIREKTYLFDFSSPYRNLYYAIEGIFSYQHEGCALRYCAQPRISFVIIFISIALCIFTFISSLHFDIAGVRKWISAIFVISGLFISYILFYNDYLFYRHWGAILGEEFDSKKPPYPTCFIHPSSCGEQQCIKRINGAKQYYTCK